MFINAASLSALFLSYKAAFQGAFAQAETNWDKVATLITSESEANLYAFLGNFPQMREWLGDRVIKNMALKNYTLTNKKFESTVEVPREKLEDDTFGIFSTLMQEMGYTAKTHPDEMVFGALKNGASNLCYDGQNFFDTDHPVVVDGAMSTKSNYDAAGGGNLWALLDTKRPLKPLIFQKRREYAFQAFASVNDEHVFKRASYLYGVDARCAFGYGLWQLAYGSLNTLDSTNVQAYAAAMMALKSDEGKSLGIMPDTCVVGPSNWAAARALFLVPTLTGGAANPNFGLCKVIVTPQLV